jgi:hypothetical protein
MPRTVSDISILRRYIGGVVENAEHHADNVDEVALALIGAVVWRKDEDSDIEVMTREGRMTNVLWVRIGGNRYAFSYNHEERTIELRRGNTHGDVLHSFSNRTTNADIKRIFQGL